MAMLKRYCPQIGQTQIDFSPSALQQNRRCWIARPPPSSRSGREGTAPLSDPKRERITLVSISNQAGVISVPFASRPNEASKANVSATTATVTASTPR